MGVINPFDFFIETTPRPIPSAIRLSSADLKPYLDVPDSARGRLDEWVAASATPPADGQPTVQFLAR